MAFGTEISSYISKPRVSSPICLALTTVNYATKRVSILSSVILFIIVGLTPFFDAASHLTKPRKPSMTAILEPMVVTCLGMLLPRRSYKQGIFGLLYSMIVSLPSKNSMLSIPTTIKYDHTLLLYTLCSPLVPLQNGVSIS
jgi:hypothetical protein